MKIGRILGRWGAGAFAVASFACADQSGTPARVLGPPGVAGAAATGDGVSGSGVTGVTVGTSGGVGGAAGTSGGDGTGGAGGAGSCPLQPPVSGTPCARPGEVCAYTYGAPCTCTGELRDGGVRHVWICARVQGG